MRRRDSLKQYHAFILREDDFLERSLPSQPRHRSGESSCSMCSGRQRTTEERVATVTAAEPLCEGLHPCQKKRRHGFGVRAHPVGVAPSRVTQPPPVGWFEP